MPQAFADLLLAHPDAPIAAIASQCGASRRTLERLFARETNMTIGAWRRRSRFVAALSLLADGESVTAVAHRVGYGTPSAFSYAFRLELGSTPRHLLPQYRQFEPTASSRWSFRK